MIRLKDIAAQAGVSVMTVSKALRDAPDVSATTKARVKVLAQQMGYVPDTSAQGLRTRTTRLLGLVIGSCNDPFVSPAVAAIQDGASEMGYDVLVAHTDNLPEKENVCIRRLLARRIEGLLIAPAYSISPEAPVYAEIRQRGTPTVILGQRAPFCSQQPNVQVDDLLASYSVTMHLLKLGHKRIAFLAGPTAAPWAQERFEGYRRALREVGIDVDDKLVFQAGRGREEGARAVEQMLQENCNATAVQAVNDLVAIGCAQVLKQRGIRVPAEVSLAGFGNLPLTDLLEMPLTTAHQPKYRLGVAAISVMRQLLLGKPAPDTKPLPAELIPRASTGTAPAPAS